MLQIFISYARQDEREVSPLQMLLGSRGYTVWLDRRSIYGGAEWAKEIEHGIISSDVFLLCCSVHSMASEWVERELDIALKHHKPIIPLLLEPVDLPERVRHVQWIDFTAHEFYQETFERLVSALQAAEQHIAWARQHGERPLRLFLSYQHRTHPDEQLAEEIRQAFDQSGYNVFMDDQAIQMGTHSAERVLEAIDGCDIFVILLSESSVDSQVAALEVVRAYEKMQTSGLILIPVRVGLRRVFPYQLRRYLDPIPWGFWNGLPDTPRIIEEIRLAIQGSDFGLYDDAAKHAILDDGADNAMPAPQPFANPVDLEQPTGTVSPDSQFYVERDGDRIAVDLLTQARGSTLVIRAPRQMGKSSLMMRSIHHAQQAGKRVAYLDFQEFDSSILLDPDQFYRQFSRRIVRRLRLQNEVEDTASFWDPIEGPVMLCSDYMEEEILPALDGDKLVLAIDEVDRMFLSPFSSDFFGMLRSWHNRRSYGGVWRDLDLVLIISTEPYLLIDNPNQSPFNVGTEILLHDFTAEQVAELNQRHGSPLNTDEVAEFCDLIGGHPYLTREGLYQVATGRVTAADLLDENNIETGPFANHLAHFLFLLSEAPELQPAMRQVIGEHTTTSRDLAGRLQSAGLVQVTADGVYPRCRLYRVYFSRSL